MSNSGSIIIAMVGAVGGLALGVVIGASPCGRDVVGMEPDYPCPHCTYYKNADQLQGELDWDYDEQPFPFTNPELIVRDKKDVILSTTTISPATQYAGTNISQTVTWPVPGVDPLKVAKAELKWLDDDGNVVSQPVPVE